MKKPKTVLYIDPLNGEKRRVQSVYRPVQTLLQGKEHKSAPTVLKQTQRYYVWR